MLDNFSINCYKYFYRKGISLREHFFAEKEGIYALSEVFV